MGIYESKLWISDLDEVIARFPIISELEGRSVLITGASGLICSAIVDLLVRYNETHDKKATVIAAGRNIEKIRVRFAPFSERDYFVCQSYDAVLADNDLNCHCDYIIHGASNASPGKIIQEPVETMLCNFLGMKSLLDYARATNSKRILFISSSEIYGKKENDKPYNEGEYGYIDVLSPRNSYSVSKRATETLCISYAAEYGIDSVIVRPGHIYGPTAVATDNRVSSAWAYACARGEDIILKSDGSQLRSYCYCLDCASAILTALAHGKNGRAYNISNPDSVISIRQMAEILTQYSGVKLKTEFPTTQERNGFNPMRNSSLDSTALQHIGWSGLFSAERGFKHTIDILKSVLFSEGGMET